MEQKKIQRIIGIVAILALVVVIMPLLFGKNNSPTQEASNIKTLPIPDQRSTISNNVQTENAAVPANPLEAQTSAKLPEPPALAGQINPAPASETKVTEPAPAVGNIIYDAPSATPQASSTPQEADKKPVDQQPSVPTPPVVGTSDLKKNEEIQEPVKVQPAVIRGRKERTKPQKLTRSVYAKTVAPHHKKETAVWVVQVGNFAVKQNAIHLANVLRAAGYKAFTHDVKSSIGKMNTRVYVGPELKQASAVQLSHTIHRNLSLPGFVVTYHS